MRNILVLTAAALLAASPAFAQDTHDHSHDDHQDHNADSDDSDDHASHDHEGHETMADDESASATAATGAPLQRTPEIEAALTAGGEPVVVDVLGVVCDFCAKAMNKTFGKRDEVAAVYVDLDSKTLNLVLKPSMTLADDAIHKLVKKAGYRAASIRRGEAALKGTVNATDPS